MKTDSIQDSTRYVVAEVHHGGILPGARKEMWREVYLLSGADVRGGIWCGSLAVMGPDISVSDSVYCRGAATIEPDDDKGTSSGDVTFESCFSCSDSLKVGKVPFRVRFLSDVYAQRVNLNQAVIYGNLYAREAILTNSLVLGGVFCRGRLRMKSSMVGTFQAGRAQLGEGVSLLFPSAVARETLELGAPVRVLTFMNLKKRRRRADKGAAVSLDSSDVASIRIPSQGGGPAKKIQWLSLAARALDSDALFRHLQINRRLLEHLAIGSHLDPDSREAEHDEPRQELEDSLWKIMSSRSAPTMKKKVTIEDLCERFSIG